MRYQVGHLKDIKNDDPVFDTLELAAQDAMLKSQPNRIWDGEPYGVWTSQDDGCELVAIAYEGVLFTA